ncbi:glutathione S-transferase [Acetobacter oeni]|uniref:Glutathione S-transferase n=1 Tax=Acetobacter oeni TaxID=304077 RepID=A0A511XMQ2_9PROT|nr:glutathione S-transferase [Acetobacter oeni]MBB3884134.1 glutathione S-transferase [Acetobacter oeni]GEN64220.1 glutathione S-transferase [Acetobacter oeni]
MRGRAQGAVAWPVLWSFRRCPYAMRARLALLVSGVRVEVREVLLREKPAAMLAVSPKGTVPVLVLPDGVVIDESLDVMRWALGRDDPEGWLPGADFGLVGACDGVFKFHLDRYKYFTRYGCDPLEHRTEGVRFLKELEARLSGGFLCGERFRLTDAAVLPFVRQFAAVDAAWFGGLDLPRVRGWLEGFVSSALFARAMRRYAVWRPGDEGGGASVCFPEL